MGTVDLWGTSFELHPEGISEYALLEFAAAQRDVEGGDAESTAGMAAMFDLVMDTLAETARRPFRMAARKNRAKASDLMRVIEAATVDAAERPTSLPSDSSAGQTVTVPRSESVFEKAERLSPGRPDLQMATVRALQAAG